MSVTDVVLDPPEVAVNRTALSLNTGAINVTQDGIDWGDAEIEAYMADAKLGQIPIDFRVPNRVVRIPLLLGADGAAGFQLARSQLKAKVALFQREGGWISRASGLYADVVNAKLTMPDRRGHQGLEADVVLTLEAIPDFYGDEITLGDHVETTTPELVFLQGASYFQIALSYTPSLYWRLGQNGATDQSGNGRNGTGAGGVTIGGAASMLANDTDAATDFDGTDDRITSTYNPFTNGSQRTFCGWANRDTSSSIDTLFGSDTATAGAWVRLHLASGSNDVVFTVNGGTNSVTWTAAWPGNAIATHWMLTFNEATDTAELFINGVSQGTKTVAQAYNATPGNFEIGARSGASDPFDGKQDEVAAFQGLLTVNHARVLYQAGRSDSAVLGDHPGRVRIVVDEDQGQSRHGLIWAIRSRHYSFAPTAQLAYEAEALTPLDQAAAATVAGASGISGSNNVVQHSTLARNWTPVLSTQIAGVGHMTHSGTYRVWARVQTTSPGVDAAAVRLRLLWDVADLTMPTQNAPKRVPWPNGFYLVDLGLIRSDPSPVGAHRWQGVIQGIGDVGGENIAIDRVYTFPVDEGYGELRAPQLIDPGLSGFSSRDEFNQSSGALAGKTAPVGGAWTGGGDADDFTINTTAHTVQRIATSDVGGSTPVPRLAWLPNSLITTAVQADVKNGTPGAGYSNRLGVAARIVNASNHFVAYLGWNEPPLNPSYLLVGKQIAGAFSTIAYLPMTLPAFDAWFTVRLVVDAAGRFWAGFVPQGSPLNSFQLTGRDPDLATGGVLASGFAGIYDHNPNASAGTRQFDNLITWQPDIEAVLHPNQSLELRTDRHFREDVTGSAWGPVPSTIGGLPRIPAAGIENRISEVILLPTRGDLDEIPDAGIDDASARIIYRPSWLFPHAA